MGAIFFFSQEDTTVSHKEDHRSTFDRVVAHVLKNEGGLNENEPDGAIANFGINSNAHPNIDVRSLTEDDAIHIYRTQYWDRIRGDDLPPQVAAALMDFATQSGVGRSTRMLQAIVGVEQDGSLGPRTLKAVKSKDADKVTVDLIRARATYLEALGTNAKYMKYVDNWRKRIRANAQFAGSESHRARELAAQPAAE